MNDFTFTKDAFAQYMYWQTQDKKTLKKSTICLRISAETEL